MSVEIIFDAIHRLRDGPELQRLRELMAVTVTGLVVNLVGLAAFGHAHHGHDHGHSHGHERSHADGHSHDAHDHSHGHNHSQSHTPISASTPAAPPSQASKHSHSHSHGNDNMWGIWLHVAADALGSVAVIISTALTMWYGGAFWDPLASCVISVLIFGSALPLVKSTGMRLLLTLPDEEEYGLREALQELSGLRGVVSYAVPRFWVGDAGGIDAHEHGHGEECDHHDRDHDHDHGHRHEHGLNHGHEHEGHGHEGHAHIEQRIVGVIHVIAARTADVEDVRERTVQFLKGRGVDAVVQVEREGEGRCWCGGGARIGG